MVHARPAWKTAERMFEQSTRTRLDEGVVGDPPSDSSITAPADEQSGRTAEGGTGVVVSQAGGRSGQSVHGMRVAAAAALVLFAAAVVVAVVEIVLEFPRGLVVVALLVAGLCRGVARGSPAGPRPACPSLRRGAAARRSGRRRGHGGALRCRSRRRRAPAGERVGRQAGVRGPRGAPRRRPARARDRGVEPAVGRGQGRQQRPRRRRTRARDRADRAEARRRPRATGARRRGARGRRARGGGRRRNPGTRGVDRCGARPAVRLHPGRHPQPLRARPGSRSRRRRRRPRRVRRRRRAPRRPGRGQRSRVRQQRVARALRRGGTTRGVPRREAAHHPRHRARRARPAAEWVDERVGLARRGRHRQRVGGDDPGLEQRLPPRARHRIGHAAADRRAASWVWRC